ncbi:MAG: TSUP family transporter [Thiotrichales bacterium]
MEINFIDLGLGNVLFLFLVGFVGGLVSGFIGSGGAFVLTPAMMNLGVPAVMAVASNICHKFPKALVGAMKRHKYGQVDLKLGLILGVSAEAGVLYGANIQQRIVESFGKAGSNLYVSVVFVVVLAVVGGYVLRDAWKTYHSENPDEESVGKLARWVQSVNIPGTMVYFKSINARISILFTIPIGFATGMLAATIAVGGFIGVPAMMYLLGVPGLMASATELVIAFVMGLGGTIKYGWHGMVDIRLAMIILAGSLFGIQLGAIGTTYVKAYMVKVVMGVIMIMVLVSRGVAIPAYLADLDLIPSVAPSTHAVLLNTSFVLMIIALAIGAFIVLRALLRGMRDHRLELAQVPRFSPTPETGAVADAVTQLSPVGRLRRILLVTDGSEFSEGATEEAIRLAKRCGTRLHVMSAIISNQELESLAQPLLRKEESDAQERLRQIKLRAEAEGLACETLLRYSPEVFEAIVDEAESSGMDLVVMGRRGKQDLLRAMIGGTTERVIGHTHSDVLVVPRTGRIEGRRIALAVDGSRFSDAAAATVVNLVKQCPVPVTVIAAASESVPLSTAQALAKRVSEELRQAGVDVSTVVRAGRPDEVIVEAVRASDVDLIVMGSHGRTGLERLLVGSVSERVIGRAECPVWVVKL